MIDFIGIDFDDTEHIRKQYASMDKEAYFIISPQVVPTGRKSRITIRSKYDYMRLCGTYLVMVAPYYDFHYTPFETYHDRFLEVDAVDGELSFEYDFESEQIYRIIVGANTPGGVAVLLKTCVYALNDDLLSLTPLIGDFHSHTIYSDGFESPRLVLESAVSHKLDFIAITDHNNYQGSVEADEIARKMNLPITVIRGEEFSSTFTNMHIISLGAPKAMDEAEYCKAPNEDNRSLSATEHTKLLCKKIRENGGVSVMCHPLWKPFRRDGSRMDVPMSLVKSLLEDNAFDAVEVVSGSPIGDVMTTHMQYLWAQDFGATCDKVAYLGSTDAHTYSTDPICGKHFTFLFAKDNSPEAIVNAIKNKLTVAVHLTDDSNALCYGPSRLCMFAQFYLKYIVKKIK